MVDAGWRPGSVYQHSTTSRNASTRRASVLTHTHTRMVHPLLAFSCLRAAALIKVASCQSRRTFTSPSKTASSWTTRPTLGLSFRYARARLAPAPFSLESNVAPSLSLLPAKQAQQFSAAKFDRCHFEGNLAANEGGVAYARGTSVVALTNSVGTCCCRLRPQDIQSHHGNITSPLLQPRTIQPRVAASSLAKTTPTPPSTTPPALATRQTTAAWCVRALCGWLWQPSQPPHSLNVCVCWVTGVPPWRCHQRWSPVPAGKRGVLL